MQLHTGDRNHHRQHVAGEAADASEQDAHHDHTTGEPHLGLAHNVMAWLAEVARLRVCVLVLLGFPIIVLWAIATRVERPHTDIVHGRCVVEKCQTRTC